jgi:hypothetical protein
MHVATTHGIPQSPTVTCHVVCACRRVLMCVMSAPAPTQPQSDIHAHTITQWHTHTQTNRVIRALTHTHIVSQMHTHRHWVKHTHMLRVIHTFTHTGTVSHTPTHRHSVLHAHTTNICTFEWSVSCHDHDVFFPLDYPSVILFTSCLCVVWVMHVATTHGIPQSHTVTCHGKYIWMVRFLLLPLYDV